MVPFGRDDLPMKTRRNKQNRRPILTPIILVVAVIAFVHTHLLGHPTRQVAHAQTTTVTTSADSSPIPTATPTPTPTEHDQIVGYIKQVFGSDSDKAFELLTSPACHENRTLNPDAVNLNSDGSRDYSIFQINDRWQGVQGKFLLNWKVNVLIAKQLFDESHSFKMWVCGQRLGI